MQIQEFYTGKAFDADSFFGAHPGAQGTHFAVWAPSARQILVVLSSPAGQPLGEYPMQKTYSGCWETDVPAAVPGQCYQYRVTGADGSVVDHCDPYGTAMTLRPDGRSIVQGPSAFVWTDGPWMERRTKNFDSPMTIYEAQAGSWQRKPDGSLYTYEELAGMLPGYLRENGYTHLEWMPLSEYPFDGSWGYQTTGFFAPTSRYGTPDQLRALINACHEAGIGVILDFVPVHFAVDSYGLRRFDGTPLYEYPAAAVGESEWGSCNFMHSRGEIRCFLQSAADYWLREFHADGLRMDAVSRLIYWQGDPARGVNGSTLEFLRGMNSGLQKRHPTAMLIAEDSTDYPKITAPVEYGGLGFDYKWDLGWMNDTLDYFRKTPEERRQNLGKLTFSMMYFWREHYILPFSHDENVHGKATILQKMYGDYDGKFPQGRTLYLYMMIHPGKKLDFMGNEFGQLREYDENRAQDWELFRFPLHDGFAHFRRELQQLYLRYDAFWAGEYNADHFRWLDCDHPEEDVCAILRRGHASTVFALFNFSDRPMPHYTVPLPGPGRVKELLNTDWQCWGGTTEQPGTPLTESAARTFTAGLAPYSGRLFLLSATE